VILKPRGITFLRGLSYLRFPARAAREGTVVSSDRSPSPTVIQVPEGRYAMNSRLTAVLREIASLLHLDRFYRFSLPLALLLVIAFLCMVNLQQAQTIAAQHELIHTLFQDSLELSAMHMQAVKAHSADFKRPDLTSPDSSHDQPHQPTKLEQQ
jgi:hypothetical protein